MDIADKVPINWGLIRNPVNWIIILLMIFLFGLGLKLVFHNTPATGDN